MRGAAIEKVQAYSDFMTEKTVFQNNAEQVGKKYSMRLIVDRTPKHYPEVAGEGVEYSCTRKL